MKEVILLCGVSQAGKTNTLKEFFGRDISKRLLPLELLERQFNGKTFYAVSLSSPQERSREKGGFCNLQNVMAILNDLIKKCDAVSTGKDYTIVIPSGLYGTQKGMLHENCILEPINLLENKGFKVHCIYLRKKTAKGLNLLDAFMNKLTSYVIESAMDYYYNQAKEFEKIIVQL